MNRTKGSKPANKQKTCRPTDLHLKQCLHHHHTLSHHRLCNNRHTEQCTNSTKRIQHHRHTHLTFVCSLHVLVSPSCFIAVMATLIHSPAHLHAALIRIIEENDVIRTILVRHETHQAVQTYVCHFRDTAGTPANGLNCSRNKILLRTHHVRLPVQTYKLTENSMSQDT